jgi:hypothetical protein
MGPAEAWNVLIAGGAVNLQDRPTRNLGGAASHAWNRPMRVVVTPTVIHRHIGCAAQRSGNGGDVTPRRINARDATGV